MSKFAISRRAFLQSLGAVAAGAASLSQLPAAQKSSDLENTFAEIRANLLEMINEERAVAKVPLVAVDKLAEEVATRHAIDMATSQFVSHWGRDGLKPYHAILSPAAHRQRRRTFPRPTRHGSAKRGI